jgi:choline dehydrogenase-like flavoprotein
LDGRSESICGSGVVLATGAIENARILMLSDPSGIGVGTGRALTGRYLQDHPVLDVLEVYPVDPSWLQDRASHLYRGRSRLYPKVRLAPGAQQRGHLLDANAVLVHEYEAPQLDAARRLVNARRDWQMPSHPVADGLQAVRAVGSLSRVAYRRWVKGLSAGWPASRVTLQVWVEQVPDPDSRVRLGSVRDPLGLPVAEVDWRIAPEELRTSRVLGRLVADDLRHRGLASVRELPAMTNDEAWMTTVTDAYHPAGTTRMSASGLDGVVDPDGQVHGLDGLFVAGSSTFPIAGYANPTLTIAALAFRLADHLSALLRSGMAVAQGRPQLGSEAQ